MAAPTLETNAAADILRIIAGTAGNPVTWNDVWDWDDGGGSSGGDGDVPKDGGGTAKVNTFMTETVADAVYLILKHINFGDGIIPTYFQSKKEMVYFTGGCVFSVKNSATLCLGELQGDYGINGSRWSVGVLAHQWNATGATSTILIYDSVLHLRSVYMMDWDVSGGVVTIKNSTISGIYDISGAGMFNTIYFGDGASFDRVNFTNVSGCMLNAAPILFNDVHSHYCRRGIQSGTAVVTAIGIRFTSSQIEDTFTGGGAAAALILKDPVMPPTVITNYTATNWTSEVYTANIHIADKDGADLAGVVVDCEDRFGNPVWAAGTIVTDAAGDIAEQTITYKKWEGTAETLTTYSPHKFTISKAGYETLVLDEITVDHPIVWHEELQNSGSQRPRFRMHGA